MDMVESTSRLRVERAKVIIRQKSSRHFTKNKLVALIMTISVVLSIWHFQFPIHGFRRRSVCLAFAAHLPRSLAFQTATYIAHVYLIQHCFVRKWKFEREATKAKKKYFSCIIDCKSFRPSLFCNPAGRKLYKYCGNIHLTIKCVLFCIWCRTLYGTECTAQTF